MFTIKAARASAAGEERVNIYEAVSCSVERLQEGLKEGEAFVIALLGNGDQPCITVTNDKPEKDQFICHTVFIENCHGKTTEIVRAHN